MIDIDTIALGALRKIKAVSGPEPAADEDMDIARHKALSAHSAIAVQGLLRWTLRDIPDDLLEAYILLTAFFAADDFTLPKDATWWPQGMGMVQAYVQVPAQPTCGAVDF
jgi:hypothetical protein